MPATQIDNNQRNLMTEGGIRLERKEPYGFWHLYDGKKELDGVYTSQEDAENAATAYKKK